MPLTIEEKRQLIVASINKSRSDFGYPKDWPKYIPELEDTSNWRNIVTPERIRETRLKTRHSSCRAAEPGIWCQCFGCIFLRELNAPGSFAAGIRVDLSAMIANVDVRVLRTNAAFEFDSRNKAKENITKRPYGLNVRVEKSGRISLFYYLPNLRVWRRYTVAPPARDTTKPNLVMRKNGYRTARCFSSEAYGSKSIDRKDLKIHYYFRNEGLVRLPPPLDVVDWRVFLREQAAKPLFAPFRRFAERLLKSQEGYLTYLELKKFRMRFRPFSESVRKVHLDDISLK